MEIFDTVFDSEHEQIVFCHNKNTGLRATIGIHNTALGPALGGIPTWQAADRMAEERIEILGKLKMPYMGKAHRFPGRDSKH